MKPVPNLIPEALLAAGVPLTTGEDILAVGEEAGRVEGSAEEDDLTGIKTCRIGISIPSWTILRGNILAPAGITQVVSAPNIEVS